MGAENVISFATLASPAALEEAFASNAFVDEPGQASLHCLEEALEGAGLRDDFYRRVVRYRQLIARGDIIEARNFGEGIARSLATIRVPGRGTSRFASLKELVAAITATSRVQKPTPADMPVRDRVATHFGGLYLKGVSHRVATTPSLVGPGLLDVYSLDPTLRVDAQEWLEIFEATFRLTVEQVLAREQTSEVVIRVYHYQLDQPVSEDRLMNQTSRRRAPRPQTFREVHLVEVHAPMFFEFSVPVQEWKSVEGNKRVWQRFLNRLKKVIFGFATFQNSGR